HRNPPAFRLGENSTYSCTGFSGGLPYDLYFFIFKNKFTINMSESKTTPLKRLKLKSSKKLADE
ncbi:hypothetical protein, partial [Enterobacter roggenkampii]|uniref:hypothetical protein n=1 Tax=Enterobacter roggenkampii TaxID=1812935 RepID=UPI0020761A0A